jgi:phospholipase C
MKPLTDSVSTIVLVMLENRSFDHMLGHLTYENLVPGVNGLGQDLTQYENPFQGSPYQPFPIAARPLASDLPHEWDQVATQLAYSAVTEQFAMNGFVEAYAAFTGTQPVQQADPMGFFASAQVPITSFLARHFCICDQWHCPLPTSTQPNRTMAFCGASQIFDTSPTARLIPCDEMLFDWLERAGVRWRVYHDGLSFFALYPHAWPYVLSEHFRDLEHYFYDMQVEPVDTGPQVIIVEPSYNDGPHIGPDHPNDNHPPLAVGWGEDFLRRVYQAATVNPERWSKTVLVHYYDEHGGFYDHVPPPAIRYQTRGNPSHTFASLGPRVPGLVVSPRVSPGAVCHALFDHTSVLQLLAERFTPGTPYSAEVDQRRQQGIHSLSIALEDIPRTDVPRVPADPIPVASALGSGVVLRPANGNQASFDLAASQLLASQPVATGQKYPDLYHWKMAVDAERRHMPTA